MTRTDASPLSPGYRLDRYELLGPLAEGGMASVWIARQRGKHGFEKLVAVKTILPQFASDDRFRQMFLDEARIASRIEHFNVARILDLGEEHDVLYLVMEYVDGDSLSKLRRECKKKGVAVPQGVLLRVLADACAGLHEAHELKGEDGALLEIVHRDVSPHNILLSTRGVAKVIDFGIAKARDRLSGDTNVGVLKGKIQYMAPEQALGRKVDRRADLWAIGASLYHMLAGRPAYHAENTLEMLHLLTSGRPPAPLPSTVHPVIAAVVRKALSTQMEERYQTAAEMRDSLEAAMLETQSYATIADVGAFALEHLAERTAKRRKVIDIAIAAASDRERVEAALQPHIDRGTGLTSPQDGGPGSGDPSSSIRPAMAMAPPPLSAFASSPPTAEDLEPFAVPRRRGSMVVASTAGVVLALVAGLAFTKVREREAATAAAEHPVEPAVVSPVATAAGPAIPPVPTVPSEARATAGAPTAPAVDDGRDAASVGTTRAPQAAAPSHGSPPRWTPAPRAAPPPPQPEPAAAAPAPEAPEPPHRRNVDDGF